MKREICLYRLQHPKASLHEIAAIFNVKWSMPLTNYTIRYIVRASGRWLTSGGKSREHKQTEHQTPDAGDTDHGIEEVSDINTDDIPMEESPIKHSAFAAHKSGIVAF
jgi:hypothetical protein